MAGQWSFLVDECVNPEVAYRLDSAEIRAMAVKDALWLGAEDFADVLPYAREHGHILVTSNVADFRGLDDEAHEGIILVFDNELAVQDIVAGLRIIVDRYPSRNALRGYEKLDPWITNR